MKNLSSRIYTSIPLIILPSLGIFLGISYIYLIISLIFLAIFYEWNIFFIKKSNFLIFLLLFIIAILQLSFFFNTYIFYVILFINILFIFYIFYKYDLNILYIITSLYFFLSLISIFFFLNEVKNFSLLILIFLSIILFDTISYILGSIFKGFKIIPKISPQKTFSGYFFGLSFTLLIVFILNKYFLFFISNYFLLLFTTIILFSAIIGDIIESLIKRKLQIKDISNFLPGHGGFFDRFDSFLFVFITVNITYPLFIN